MENFDNIFTLVTENGSIGLNLDILETGVINIAALVGILVFTGKDFLGSILEERRTNIIQSLENAENRLKEADRRFNEAQKQLSQANILISKIKREAVESQKILLQSEISQTKKELTLRFSRATAAIRSKERQIFIEIKQQIILLMLKRTVIRVKETFTQNDKATALINETINKLDGDLL
jgi:F-type H+-transporting ATPase subunit b